LAKKFYYGGQAVIEGVMMRGKKTVVTAVRRPDGEVVTDARPLPGIATERVRRIPLIRGIAVLIESMFIGIKALMYSANISLQEEDEEEEGKKDGEEKSAMGVSWWMMAGPLVGVVALFFLAPLFLTNLIGSRIESSFLFHLVEGFIRMGIFVLYLKAISLSSDVKRVFAYHGAEHKVINAHEAGVSLKLDAVKRYAIAHVRCGTSFIFAVFIIAIVVFAIIGRPSLQVMVLSRVLLIPVIAGLGYEFTQYGARHPDNRLVRATLAPGLWLQRMTTSEPDDSQIEVALAALNKAVEIDGAEEKAEALA